MKALDPTALWLMRCLLAAFLAILFLQSGLDKAIDRKGNLEYLRGVFGKTPLLRDMVPLLLASITLLELAAGLSSAGGLITLALFRDARLGLIGALISAATLVALFFGQRVAKDYAGAAGLVPYFLTALLGIALMAA